MSMKIITWNCNMAFRKKYTKILSQNPDLLVLQECESDNKLRGALKEVNYNQLIWYGNNIHKGVAIISFNSIHIELKPDHNIEFEYIVPLKLITNKKEINLFCIWAMPNKTERRKRYVGQIWGAVNYYSKSLDQTSILVGDFNSNAIWDEKKRVGNHTDLVKILNDKQIFSIYHHKRKFEHGKEKNPTLFLTKKYEKPYHIDYCFASKNLISSETSIEIGKYEEWIKLSDHMPLIVEKLNL